MVDWKSIGRWFDPTSKQKIKMEYSQVVRHRVLTPICRGSIPFIPIFIKLMTKLFPFILHYRINNAIYLKVPYKVLIKFIYFLKLHTKTLYKELIDLSVIDSIDKKFRFEIFYHLLSIAYNQRITITTSVLENISIDSIIKLYPTANWYEREAWDMFGIFFVNHPDLRRMLTDYGFKGHPLRKDFPMTGYVELKYDDFTKRISYDSVNLAQEYRIFNLENSWSLS